VGAGVVVRRRDRLRHATVSEIKDLAWAQIAGTGAAALSLRAVARDMGMTSSALYRYFPSRDHLLTALAADGFASLADELEAAEEDVHRQELSSPAQFLHLLRVYRSWSLAHPTEYALMFGTPVPGFDECGPEPKLEMLRGVNVLFRMMVSCVESGRVVAPPLDPSVERKLTAKLRKCKGHAGEGLPPAALAACMFVWMQLHGAISLELFGHLPPDLLPADELFEQEMRQLLVLLGSTPDA
jgi:AcrR family transcriptional regulator